MALECIFCHRLIASKALLLAHYARAHPVESSTTVVPRRIRKLDEKRFVNEPLVSAKIARRKDQLARSKPSTSVKTLPGGKSR